MELDFCKGPNKGGPKEEKGYQVCQSVPPITIGTKNKSVGSTIWTKLWILILIITMCVFIVIVLINFIMISIKVDTACSPGTFQDTKYFTLNCNETTFRCFQICLAHPSHLNKSQDFVISHPFSGKRADFLFFVCLWGWWEDKGQDNESNNENDKNNPLFFSIF